MYQQLPVVLAVVGRADEHRIASHAYLLRLWAVLWLQPDLDDFLLALQDHAPEGFNFEAVGP